ncbi:MAG: branched-chain amino acid aminotransferase [Spirochaetales bacterium]|jgi:branched-chain amino acid aminotransferase|nr:branched-chain amino acid aminotransferase [Spirochaetales bacterium]
MQLGFMKRESLKEKPADESKLGFGRIFTDYMVMMKRDKKRGWYYAAIEPFEDLRLSPAALVLHYAQEVFEGLKAYYTEDGRILLFRPWENMKRMALSAARLSMVPFDGEFLLNSIYELVKLEKDWIPKAPGTSLYIRPTYIGVDPFVGVAAAEEYLLYVILSPVGAYYPRGLEPVDIFVESNYVRTVRGGTGTTKAGANYAISLLAGEEAHKKGFSQVLWLDGVEKTYVEEVGSMNIFFKIGGEIITPSLQGSILPGVTRDSILRLARDMGIPVCERRISIYEIEEAQENGKLEEVFGSGTAAVVSPVGRLIWGDKTITVGDGNMGKATRVFYDTITGIQYGRIADKYGWTHELRL